MAADSDSSPTGVVLGQGSYGRVERVSWNNGWYARKTMLSAPDDVDQGLSYSSLRECDIYARFCSPFLVSVFRMEIDRHQLHLWMGLADCSLAEYLLRDVAHSLSHRIQLVSQLLWSTLNLLRYLHTYHVLHRDLKPDNVLVRCRDGDQFDIYVSDLGSCRWVQRGMRLTGGMGTRCFRPPEMETHQYGKPSDVYGLGVTAIHTLHGLHPVEGPNPRSTPQQWHSTLQTYKTLIHPHLLDLLTRMVLAQPSRRITVADALAHDFFRGAAVPRVPKMMEVEWPGEYWVRLHSTADERRGWVDHIVTLGQTYNFLACTMVHAVHLYDDFLAQCSRTTAFELYASTAIWVAGKYFEEYTMPLDELVAYSQGRVTQSQLIEAEETLVSALHFRIVRRWPRLMEPDRLREMLSSPQYVHGFTDGIRKSARFATFCKR